MATVYIGVGSNIEPEKNIPEAIRLLKGFMKLVYISTFYCSKPINAINSPQFYNGVLKAETDFTPRQLKYDVLRKVEDMLGRVRKTDKFASRPIDLDILLYDDLVLEEDDIQLPDKNIADRIFIAQPLYEAAGNILIPGTHTHLSGILESMPLDTITPLPDFSRNIKMEMRNEP